MKFIATLIIFFAAVTTTLAAYQHDDNAADGVYSHFEDEAGVLRTVYLGPLKRRMTRRRYDLSMREDQGVQCQSSVSMNTNDAQAAAEALADIFADGMIFFKTISAKCGSSVAYGCDYGHGQGMDHDKFLGYMTDIATECGGSAAGYFRDVGSKSSYGRTNAGIGFC